MNAMYRQSDMRVALRQCLLQDAAASSLRGLVSPVVHEEECMVAALCRAW